MKRTMDSELTRRERPEPGNDTRIGSLGSYEMRYTTLVRRAPSAARWLQADQRQHFADRTADHRIREMIHGRGFGVEDDDRCAGILRERQQAGEKVHLQDRAEGDGKAGGGS